MKFNPEEISLCKQVAERHRKIVEEGDYLSFIDKNWLVYHTTGPWISVISKGAKHAISTNLDNKDEWFPLWTISDCLEFLRERNLRYDLEDYRITSNEPVVLIFSGGEKQYCRVTLEGKTPLEACLKAVLAVLEEGK